ncbi:MAG: GTPase Era [Alphaproteobacteria bacterium]|nr:GTPase Era [Alphaproteobacteria bacterium]NCQ66268.1 GTPase Era [Alphaproteobacteria bacterium]NCT06616.1 GTPase Era [Alphaproteobacteria bacterium]
MTFSNPPQNTRSGFVSIVGLTNVGKSTLMNALVGSKISIVSHKVQTTRQRVLGICVREKTQIVFVDTPGYFKPQKRLDRAMVSSALTAPKDGDITVVLVDPLASHFEHHLELIERISFRADQPVVLVINKIDLVSKPDLLEKIDAFTKAHNFTEVFLISALRKEGLEGLMNYVTKALPEGAWLYPEDQMTDMPVRLLAAEMTREKIYKYLHQELPYAVHVETEQWERFENGDVKISQIIHVARDSQKGIVLGKGGQQVKKIGEEARHEIAEMLGQKVHLKIHVRVTKNWADNKENFEVMGLDFNA